VSGPRRRDGRVVFLCLLWLSLFPGCLTDDIAEAWDRYQNPPPAPIPLPDIGVRIDSLEEDLARTAFDPHEQRSLARLSQLADIFYQRLAHRRVNSIATFHDPALREFFQSEEAFADYYADLVQKLDYEHFEANRPSEITLISLHVEESGDQAVTVVEFRGNNSLPLRFWSVDYARRDMWRLADGRWWIIPGKL
jgi:hypothetical protein